MENWITISTYQYSQDAHMVKNYLESEGVSVYLKDETTSQVLSGYGSNIGGVQLKVSEEDYNRALDVMVKGGYISPQAAAKKIDVEIVERDTRLAKGTCPFCKSTETEKLKNSDPVLRFLNTLLGTIFPSLLPPYRCNSCKKYWKYK